jgi:hypothetical protein
MEKRWQNQAGFWAGAYRSCRKKTTPFTYLFEGNNLRKIHSLKVFIIVSISVTLCFPIVVKYIKHCNYHVDINSYYKFAIRFGIRCQLFVNILLNTTLYSGKIRIIIIIIINKPINRDGVWINSLSYILLTQNIVNMELTFLAVDSTLLKTHSNFVYIHIFIHTCA